MEIINAYGMVIMGDIMGLSHYITNEHDAHMCYWW